MKDILKEFTKPTPEVPAKKRLLKDVAIGIVVLTIIILSGYFLISGSYGLIKAMFTDYTTQVIDVVKFSFGLLIPFTLAIILYLVEIKELNESIAKAVIHMMRKERDEKTINPRGFFNPFVPLAGNGGQNVDPSFTGSISIVDMSNPDNPIMRGDFNNMEEMQELKNKLINKMLNSEGEVGGKKMNKQEILDTLTDEELEQERIKAEQEEDWLWAAAIRDKINDKKNKDNL